MKQITIFLCLLAGIMCLFGAGSVFPGVALPGYAVAGESLFPIKAGHTEICTNAGIGECKVTGVVKSKEFCHENSVGYTWGVNLGPFHEHCSVVDVEEECVHCTPRLKQPCTKYLICDVIYGKYSNMYHCDTVSSTYGWSWNTCSESMYVVGQ